jgi:hypothetical protein
MFCCFACAVENDQEISAKSRHLHTADDARFHCSFGVSEQTQLNEFVHVMLVHRPSPMFVWRRAESRRVNKECRICFDKGLTLLVVETAAKTAVAHEDEQFGVVQSREEPQ